MNNFLLRTVVGIAYVALLVGSLLLGPFTAFIFFGIVTWATLLEFCTVLNRHAGLHVLGLLTATAGFLLVAFSWLWNFGSEMSLHWLALYGLLMLAMPIVGLYRRTANPLQNWMAMLAAQIYVALPFALLPVLGVLGADSAVYSWQLPLAVLKKLSRINITGRLSGLTIGDVTYDGTLTGDFSKSTAVLTIKNLPASVLTGSDVNKSVLVTCNIQMDMALLGEINTTARMCIWNKK